MSSRQQVTQPDEIAQAAAEVRKRVEEGASKSECGLLAALLQARFCGRIIDGVLVLDSAKSKQFGRLVMGGES